MASIAAFVSATACSTASELAPVEYKARNEGIRKGLGRCAESKENSEVDADARGATAWLKLRLTWRLSTALAERSDLENMAAR